MTRSTSGLVVKSNVAIVGPRVRFSAGAVSSFFNFRFSKCFSSLRFGSIASQGTVILNQYAIEVYVCVVTHGLLKTLIFLLMCLSMWTCHFWLLFSLPLWNRSIQSCTEGMVNAKECFYSETSRELNTASISSCGHPYKHFVVFLTNHWKGKTFHVASP